MDDDFHAFLSWEKTCRDTVDFKRIYVDMAGDLVAGLMLSQLVYWCLLPDEKGNSRLRVRRDGHMWAAKSRNEWWDEIRLSPKQADRAIRVLVNRGLVIRKNSLFNGKRTTHLRINWDVFRDAWLRLVSAPEQALDPSECNLDDDPGETSVLTEEPRQCPPQGNPGVDQRSTPITETTAEPTTDNTAGAAAPTICPIHNVATKLYTRDGREWYGHPLSDDNWCHARPRGVPDIHSTKSAAKACRNCKYPVNERDICPHGGCPHCCRICYEPPQEKTS